MMLPNGWKKSKIGETCSLLSGQDFPPNLYGNEEKGLPYITGASNFAGNHIVLNRWTEHPKNIAKKGDILLVCKGSFGITAIADFEKAHIARQVMALQKLNGVDRDFLYQVISMNVRNIKQKGCGLIPGIDRKTVLNIEYFLPPIEEQKRIALTLSVWDSAIEKMEKLIEAKENAKQFFFYKLVTENSCLWEIKKLSDFLTPGNKTPVLNTSLYRKMIVKLHKKGLEFNTQTREMADTRPFYIRNEGELIIGKQNYFNGSIAIVDKEHDQCICSNAIMSFSIKDIHPLYLYEYISDEEYLKKHSMLANGTGQKELSEKDFLNFEIRVPKRKQQDEIVCVLNNCSLEIFLLHAQLENYKKQKQGLMQKLLTGEWRVK